MAPRPAIRYQAMLIICPNCTTTYDVGSQALGDSGRIVRCTRCLREWIATASTIPPPGQMLTPAPSRPFAAAAVADRVALAGRGVLANQVIDLEQEQHDDQFAEQIRTGVRRAGDPRPHDAAGVRYPLTPIGVGPAVAAVMVIHGGRVSRYRA